MVGSLQRHGGRTQEDQIGGIFLCTILFTYDSLKQLINGSLLYQINISSLIILVGVAYEIQKTIRSLYRNVIEVSI